jgi:hypothetical protein
MDLRQIAEVLQIPAAILATGRKGKPKLKLVKSGNDSNPSKPA